MLESTGMVPAGVIVIDDEPAIIYCNPETGECAYELPSIGMPQEVGEVHLTTPLECEDLDSLISAVRKSGDCIGMILSTEGDHVVIVDEDHAYIGRLGASGELFTIDLSADFEGDFEDEIGEIY